MAHTVLWTKRPFFYPIGNTPPASFTRELSPEEDAQVLLLGCGDPRSILYTIHTDLGPDDRKLDFTCCDLEPAILARNILLLTLIADGISSVHAWRISYHLYLDDESNQILLSQCRTLVESASDLEAWNASKYGKYLRFCTKHTLAEIRRHLQLYIDADSQPEAEKKALKRTFTFNMKGVRDKFSGSVISSTSAGGPLSHLSFLAGGQSYESFWSTGLTTSNSSNRPSASSINPTFTYSLAGQIFNVHYGTDPIKSFHWAPALVSLKSGIIPPATVTAKDLTKTAMQQFSAWYSSFQHRITKGSSITIRFFAGECLAFCRALHLARKPSSSRSASYASPWGMSRVELSEADYNQSEASAPLIFNVVDTSNLTDHLGLLNVLLVTVPLLQRNPWAVLHTNTLVQSNPNEKSKSALADNTFSDISTLSLFLGVAPTSRLFHFNSHSDKHELLAPGGQLHELIIWKYPSAIIGRQFIPYPELERAPPILVCDGQHLANFFFSLYLQMFSEETFASATLQRMANVHYTRTSFVMFLAFVKKRVEVNWNETMNRLLRRIEADRSLLMGPNFYQELICQLHLHGLYTMDTLKQDFVESVRSSSDPFRGWKDVPPVVCVVLKVPRKNLRILENMDREDIKVPVMQCETRGHKSHNIHPQIRPTFGDITVSRDENGEPHIEIKEDMQGWDGDSPLIVTFDAPSWIYTKYAQMATVGLYLRASPAIVMTLMSKLGRELNIYDASLMDEEHLHFVRFRPNDSAAICPTDNSPIPAMDSEKNGTGQKVVVSFDASGTKAISLTIREDIKDPDSAKVLADGASVTSKAVADSALLVSFRGHERLFSYPYPVYGSQRKTRVARKSLYIEIECPIRADFSSSIDLSLNLFPIAKTKSSFNLVNIHYLKLDVLPALKLPTPASKLQWISSHLGMTMSEQERSTQRSGGAQTERGMMVNLKESIASFFMKWTNLDLPGAYQKVFSLSDPKLGIYALVFINDIRLDLSSHTIVVDACVIPLTSDNSPIANNVMRRNSGQGLIEIFTLEDEMKAWRSLLPAFAERCRTWKHTDKCEYRTDGIPACGEGIALSPLCSCGRGKDLGAFGTMKDWKAMHSEATRVAISPLFSFSFMEKTMKEMMNDLKASMAKKEAAPSGGSSSPGTCAQCSAPGKPKLLICSACKKTEYCSQECQKRHWRVHKLQCGK